MNTYQTKIYIDKNYFIDMELIMHLIKHKTYKEEYAEAGVVTPALVTMTFKIEYLNEANDATR